jgi:hypothetical protein
MMICLLSGLTLHNLPEIGKRLAHKANCEDVAAHFTDPSVRKAVEVDVSLID